MRKLLIKYVIEFTTFLSLVPIGGFLFIQRANGQQSSHSFISHENLFPAKFLASGKIEQGARTRAIIDSTTVWTRHGRHLESLSLHYCCWDYCHFVWRVPHEGYRYSWVISPHIMGWKFEWRWRHVGERAAVGECRSYGIGRSVLLGTSSELRLNLFLHCINENRDLRDGDVPTRGSVFHTYIEVWNVNIEFGYLNILELPFRRWWLLGERHMCRPDFMNETMSCCWVAVMHILQNASAQRRITCNVHQLV